ncbi:Bax inhibitor-1/YccA family protein [Saccharicrinis aurantiacus]|uniref:Bax inhibitor-1/YccA family protein n=1 Tax=Saccharicrinis aurantiacus TaxID=1849719 RepID=UPI0024917961|nr:Bax inhibitor-1/YccA family protein [Saccharicrinis aurantiacus]
MAFYKSKNPALSNEIFINAAKENITSESMTIEGTVNKTAILGLIVFISAFFTWNLYTVNQDFMIIKPYVLGGSILGFIVAVIIIYKKHTVTYLAPVYCILQGLSLGGISAYMESIFPGIVVQALGLTFGILFSLLLIYKLGLIKATENFKLIIASATAGIAVFYLISMIGRFFGLEMSFLHESSGIGIGFSVFVVIIASLNLVMDFDFIENGAESNAPKYMEWYGAFGLMVTLIWLYLEILRLLSKLRSK